MLKGLEHVGKAIDLLTLSEGTLVERLQAAMPEFRLSLARREEWPEELFPLAHELDREFTTAAAGQLQFPKAREIAEHLLMLADTITVLLSEEAHRQLGKILGNGPAQPPRQSAKTASRRSAS